jgi:kynurenine formamidase
MDDFSTEQLRAVYAERNNWGRWGEDDERGTVNLIDERATLRGVAAARTGKPISLSRPLRAGGGAVHNPTPVSFMVGTRPHRTPDSGLAYDRIAFECHGYTLTHIDALCHIWAEDRLWGDRDPSREIASGGSSWGGIEQWKNGIVTRAVLLDIPALRATPYADPAEPITGGELESALQAAGVDLFAGDAVVVYSGREAWEDATRDSWQSSPPVPRPGLGPSAVPFFRDHDVAALVWDCMDHAPDSSGLAWTAHGMLVYFGLPLIDNASLAVLVSACREASRYDFMLTVAPLDIPGGTGSVVNPIAIL